MQELQLLSEQIGWSIGDLSLLAICIDMVFFGTILSLRSK